METMAENKGGNTEEKMLKEWMRAQETASKGVIITDVKIEDSVVKIEGWVKSARIEGKEYGVLLPLERGLKGYMIRMDEATHECNDIKYNRADVCRHTRAFAIYVKEHFKEIKKEYKLKGVNLA